MAEKNPVAEHKRRRHRAQPVEVISVELPVRGAVPRSHLLGRPVDQITVVIAEHVNRVERHQRVHRPPRVERAARHVAEVDDLVDVLGVDVSNDRFKREIVSVHVGNRGKAHGQAYPGGVPLAASTWPARYSEPVIRMRGGTS